MRFLIAGIYSLITAVATSTAHAEVLDINVLNKSKLCAPIGKSVFYVVEKGDHLADIIRTFGFKPLYGKKSRVTQVSNLNEISDPNLIFPGQEVYLPFNCEEDTAKYVLIERELDRQIDTKYLVKVKTKILSNGYRETVMRLPSGKFVEFNEASLPTPNQEGFVERPALESSREVASEYTKTTEPMKSESQSEDSKIVKENILNYFVPHSSIFAGLLYGFHRIDSKAIEDGATALLLSRPSTGLAFSWQLQWTPRLSTGFNFALRQIEMKRASIGSLSEGKQTISGFGIDFQYQWTEKFKSILDVNYEERLFVRAIQSGTALLEVYQQPNFDLRFEHEVARSGSLGFDLMLGYRQMLKTSTESATMFDSGEYMMGANFRQQLEKMQIELKINYLKGQQKTNLTEQENTGIEAQIGVKMEIGP